MNTFLNYLVEASISLVLFYGVYHLLLRNETNFHFVRMYLLLSLISSLLFPFINLPATGNASVLPTVSDAIPTYWLPEIIVGNEVIKNDASISIWQTVLLIYSAGILFLFLRLLIQLNSLMSYLRKSKVRVLQNTHVLEVADDKPTFSFFQYIVIGQAHLLSEDDKQKIVAHEKIHVARYHSLDILLINVMNILLWFNPIIYLYKKALVQVHEFEADSRAVTNHDVDQYCGLLAKVALHSAEFPIANHFTNSLTLKRITMLRHVKHTLANWKKAILLSVGVLTFLLIACEDQVMSDIQTVAKQSSVVTDYPAEVQKVISDIKAKNPNAEVQVVGVIKGDETAMENLNKTIQVSEIRTMHVVKPEQKTKADYDNYIIIEKGASLNQVSSFTATDGEVFTIVEETALPVGGMNALYELLGTNLQYPVQARQAGTEGKVFVQFIVNENGALSDFTVLKGIGNGCDEEAVRALSLSPNWIPGKQHGKAVKQRMVLPITFNLSGPSHSTLTTGPLLSADKKMDAHANISFEANQKYIKGYVKDNEGNPLSGVNIVVENDTQGTVTKADGSFEIRPSKASGRLAVSYIGYKIEFISF